MKTLKNIAQFVLKDYEVKKLASDECANKVTTFKL